ncbi:ciliogenesis and planar polarity effector 1 isoform 2-T2 [Odontesthes bonariensis]|uniref:ciliogenesis and planar polarity effector 1 isoform X2 n=1 Tax=Odontesthes bonariensis TaxID=219752 RepID=UPI003F58D5B7
MELKLEVVLSSSIKRKKPWPRFCWLGQEKESVFLLDDKRISEINMVSGRTKKRTPKLHLLLNNVVTMASSDSGMWLCGLLVSGELFLWNRDKDLLKTAAAVPDVVQTITNAQGSSTRLSLQVSGDGMRVLLVGITGQVFLWECVDVRDLTGLRDGPVKGHWAHVHPLKETILPSSQDKEASQHVIFVKSEVMGDTCLTAFVFTSGKQIIITILKIQWEEGQFRVGSPGYSIQWATKKYPMAHLTPPCQPVKSRGALVPAFSPDGRLLAIVLNQRKPKATQVLFVSTQNFVSVSSGLGGCGSKKVDIPARYIRSYWVGSVSWSPGGLFLACVLKRGSLLMLARLGGLLTLTSSGCNVDFDPAHFLPLHPLVTYRPPMTAGKGEACLSSSSMSVRDVLRQRYSVTWHPRLLYLIVSDGYMATVMRVLDMPSPALLLKTLLKDTTKDLEKIIRKLDKKQIHVKAWLESASFLNLYSSLEEFNTTVTCGPNNTDSIISAGTEGSKLPVFLQDQCALGGTKELLESMQAFFEDESDIDGLPAGSHEEDGGRLEFASMFDTLHALDTHNGPDCDRDSVETEKKTALHRELRKIQSRLLTAWAFGMSLGNAVKHRVHLLRHTLYCAVQFAALLHLMPTPVVHTGEKNKSTSNRLLHLIKALLSFLSWDSTPSDEPQLLGLMVEFSKWIVRLLLTPHPDSRQITHCHLSSQTLSRIMRILQMVSDSLDYTYRLRQKNVWSTSEEESPSQPPLLWPSDVYQVSLLQDEMKDESSFSDQTQPVPQRPSSRLLGVWQLVYNVTLQYAEELKSFKGCDGWAEEKQQLSVILSQIQTALQATGVRLEEGPALLNYPGEHLFVCGLYPKSAETWRLQICQEAKKSSDRSVFQETRLCLALLYSLLSQYHLREAQELGDHMAQLILLRAGHQRGRLACVTDSLPCPWLPTDLHSDASCAVVQSLGRFMASYFTNQPLYILPAHNVAVLPPLHLPHAPCAGRLVPLCQEEVARAVRQQHLSEVWTVDYAQDLLLLGGLLPEAAWLAYHLGDWKTAVSLSLAYTSYCTEHLDFTRLRKRELHLPTVLEPESIFKAELECLLATKADSQVNPNKIGDKSFTDPLEGEDWVLLQASIQEILKASVMAGVNVMSSPLSSLLDTAKDMCSFLPTLVPTGLYLPSPPLYCPQPSPNTQDQIGTTGHLAEVACRHKVSSVLQRLLLLLRSGHCCHPAAQWYISHLGRARHILHKIKKKYSYPSATQEEKSLPEGLMKLNTRSGYFKGPNKDGHLNHDTIHTIVCFRELCALCWMLHVRDQLSIHCRKYQAARQHDQDERISGDPGVSSACVDALRWACRLLPFSRFLNAEEVLQDILLSLVSELPPVSMVADTLVRAFPEEEESVRVPLREKYNSLLQRLRQCNVQEGETDEVNELMMIVIQDKFRQRRKHLARLQRHLAPPVLHLWEKEEQEEDKGSRHGIAVLRQLSLGTSLSTSTLTDLGFQPVCSDVEAAENTSEGVSPQQHRRTLTRGKKAKKEREDAKKTAVKIKNVMQGEGHRSEALEKEQLSLPVVGTWEFELEDEEYLNFLELFFSYVLEKNNADGGDSGSELPLLRGFCSELRERELHSLTFDVLTTVHRRQRHGHQHSASSPPVFRAGCCFKPVKEVRTPELQASSIWSEAPISRPNLSVSSHPGWRTGRQKGLFGLRQQSNMPIGRVKEDVLGSEISPVQSALAMAQPSESCSVLVEAVTELQQGLDPKLEAQFPELGRLLEWMVRWADRRVLWGHRGKKKKDEEGAVDEGVVIRVKASAPAVLTSLSLLECKYAALATTSHHCPNILVPEMQWTVAPVLQPKVERRLERESSVDTGYPGSANTPITGLDQNLQQGERYSASCTDEPEEHTFQGMNLPADQTDLTSDSQHRYASSQQLCVDDLDVTPEKEVLAGRGSDSEGLGVLSSGSSGNISRNICTPETLSDLDYSEKAEDVSSSCSLHSYPLEHPEPPAPPTVQPEVTVDTELSDLSAVQLPNTAVNPPNVQPQTYTAGAATADSTPYQPSTVSPTRQCLGEELFRLVQHINYVSLREVLGASFSSIQQAQQNSTVAQPNMISHLHVPLSSTTKCLPETNVVSIQPTITAAPQIQTCVPNSRFDDPQFSQNTACRFADQPAMHSSAKTSSAADQYRASQSQHYSAMVAGVNNQELSPLPVQAESPNIQQTENKGLIPSSQGLLAAAEDPSAEDPSGVTQDESVPQMLGLKLLKLHRPLVSQHSTPHYPPAQQSQTLHTANPETLQSCQHKLKHNDQDTLKKNGGEQRKASSVPKKHLSFHASHYPTPGNSQSQIWAAGQSSGQEVSVLPLAFPAHTPTPVQGLRLLQLQKVQHTNITFPKLPLPSYSRPAFMAAPVTEMPVIKLLHIETAPKIMLPKAVPSTQMTRLFSVGELTSSVVGRRDAEEARLQLLKVDQSNESTRKPTTISSCSTSKRQSRREKKAKERGTEVTFRPNESITTQEAADVAISEKPAVAEDNTNGQEITGSSDYLLTGQRILDQAFSTSAQLHAFASISKRPPECQDAFTNTDPACPPVRVDKCVSVQARVMTKSPKPQSSGNFQMCKEEPVRNTEETPEGPEILDLGGRQFITVLDLEDVMPCEYLSPRPIPEAQDVSSIRPSSPTSAQLHVLATSVIRNAAAAAEPQPSATILENPLKPTRLTGHYFPEESPSLSHYEPSGISERNTPQDNVMVDPSDSEICRAIKTLTILPDTSSASIRGVLFSSRLSELDAQMAAVQNIADHLEMDFSNSGMPVNSVGKLGLRTTTAGNKTVRLSVPLKAWTPRSDQDILSELRACKEDKRNQEEEGVVHDDSDDPGTKPSPHLSTSPRSHRAGQSYLQTPSGTKDHSSETYRISHEWTDDDLGQTGLSDTIEILDELVKEGYLSPTDWNVSTSQTAYHSSRQDQLQNSRTSQERAFLEDERRELRVWMRRKQRERLAAYQKHRETLRQGERKPFSASPRPSANRNLATTWRTEEEKLKKEKLMLLEQYNQRTREACSLARDLGPSPLLFSTTRSTSAPPTSSAHRAPNTSVNDKRTLESQSGQTPQSVQGRPSEDLRRRLGLHRPVSFLPGDRLSQVTRRGMLGNTKGWHVGYQRKAGSKSSFSGGAAAGRGILREQTRATEEDLVDSSLSNGLRGHAESNLVLAGLSFEQDDGATGDVSGTNRLDNLSESAGSSLSRIDWAAIERMVASEED